MLATPAGELHVVALRMVDNLLGEAGYDVVMLGPDVPAADLAAAAGRHEPHVICGGRGLSSRVRSEPGIRVCERIPEVTEAVDAMVKRADLN